MTKNFLNQILLGDCLSLLKNIPDNSIDAVITDPPYCSGGRSSTERAKNPIKKYEQSSNKIVHRPAFVGDTLDQRAWMHWCILWINECYRILKSNGYFLMFSDWRQLPVTTDVVQICNLIWRGIIVWDKTNGARVLHKGYFKHQCEYVIWSTKGACKNRPDSKSFPGCFKFPVKQNDKFHLAGKPTPLMEELVQIVPENGIILDPFCGSGTTCLAAKKLKRNYIGFEKTETYYNIALNRLM